MNCDNNKLCVIKIYCDTKYIIVFINNKKCGYYNGRLFLRYLDVNKTSSIKEHVDMFNFDIHYKLNVFIIIDFPKYSITSLYQKIICIAKYIKKYKNIDSIIKMQKTNSLYQNNDYLNNNFWKKKNLNSNINIKQILFSIEKEIFIKHFKNVSFKKEDDSKQECYCSIQ